MGSWLFPWALLVAGVTLAVGPAAPGGRHRTLTILGKSMRIRWDMEAGGRLAQGAEVEQAIITLVARVRRAAGVFLACFAGSMFVVAVGPHLSTSDATSVEVAALCVASVVLPLVMVRMFLRPFDGQSSASGRQVTIEDYVSPVARVVGWVTASGVLAIPVIAVVAARSSELDGSKLWWEGLVGVPLSVAGVVISVEHSIRGATDRASSPGMLHLWDVLRSAALRLALAAACILAARGWAVLAAGLHGVALTAAPEPAWVHSLWQFARMASLLQALAAIVFLFGRWRFRSRLWTAYDVREPIAL